MRKIIKKSVFVVIGLACFLGFGYYCRAQNIPNQQGEEYGAMQTINLINAKIDKLAAQLDKPDKDVLAKLDQIVSNQQKILAELDVVKIRATRK